MLIELDKSQVEFLVKVLETSSGIFDSGYNVNFESQEYKLAELLKKKLKLDEPFEGLQVYDSCNGITVAYTPYNIPTGTIAGTDMHTENPGLVVWDGSSWMPIQGS